MLVLVEPRLLVFATRALLPILSFQIFKFSNSFLV